MVDDFPPGEPGLGGISPAGFPAFLLEVDGTRPYGSTVVVDDDFVGLCITLAWRIDTGSSVFEHGDEIGQYKGLGELIFGGAEQPGTLPAPLVLAVDVVLTVTLPDGDMASGKAAGDVVRTGKATDPRSSLGFEVMKQAFLVFFPFVVEVGDEVFDASSFSIQSNVEIVHRSGQKLTDATVDSVGDFGAEGLVGKAVASINMYLFPGIVDAETVQAACAETGSRAGVVVEKIL